MRKTPTHLVVYFIIGLASTALVSAQTLLLDYDFNGASGSTATNAGSVQNADLTYRNSSGSISDMYSAPGTGVSGGIGDTALDNAGVGMGTAGNNPAGASTSSTSADFGTLGSFTIAGWYKASSTPGGNAKMFDLDGDNTLTVISEAGQSGRRIALSYNGALLGNSFSMESYATTDEWVFWAVTFDGTSGTDNLNFYVGDNAQASSVQSAGTRTISSGLTGDLELGDSVGIGIANGYYLNGVANRPFDGLMDDIAFYGAGSGSSDGALSMAQIEVLRQGNIPEPSSLALIFGGVVGGLALYWRRRKSACVRS